MGRFQDREDDASLVGMGTAIVQLREHRGMNRDDLAGWIEEDPPMVEAIEQGETAADWATLRVIAHALKVPLYALMELAADQAPGEGGEEWRQKTREAERAWGEAAGVPGTFVLPEVTPETFGESELDDLDDRVAQILRMRSGMLTDAIPSCREVGEELGLSGGRVQQLERQGLGLLRQLREVQRHYRLPSLGAYPWSALRRVGV